MGHVTSSDQGFSSTRGKSLGTRLYLSLVRSHLSFGCEIWAPQGPSADLLRLEGIQRQATKFILKDYESSYPDRLKNSINSSILLA
jgi:hypothetical protein